MRYVTIFIFGLLSQTAWTQDSDTATEVDQHISSDQQTGASIERLGNQSVEEIRVSRHLRAIKIDPDDGPAYYLKDRSGDGLLDDSHDSMDEDVNLRKWRLGQW